MAKMVGYACSIKLQWLNKAVQLLNEDLSESEYKDKLNEYLSFEIDSPTRLRKTREILMNTWVYEDVDTVELKKEAKELIEKFPEYDTAIHLCLIYLAYPVVADICKIIGKILEFQDDITNAVVKQKLFDEWGGRGTLETTARRVTLTLKELGILEAPTKTRYTVIKSNINNDKVVNFILSVAMKIDASSYYSLSSISTFPILFPYSFKISKEQILADERFLINNFGGELTVALN